MVPTGRLWPRVSHCAFVRDSRLQDGQPACAYCYHVAVPMLLLVRGELHKALRGSNRRCCLVVGSPLLRLLILFLCVAEFVGALHLQLPRADPPCCSFLEVLELPRLVRLGILLGSCCTEMARRLQTALERVLALLAMCCNLHIVPKGGFDLARDHCWCVAPKIYVSGAGAIAVVRGEPRQLL